MEGGQGPAGWGNGAKERGLFDPGPGFNKGVGDVTGEEGGDRIDWEGVLTRFWGADVGGKHKKR